MKTFTIVVITFIVGFIIGISINIGSSGVEREYTTRSTFENKETEQDRPTIQMWVSANRANVRSEPTTESDVIETFYQGDIIKVVEQNERWYKVLFGGKEGFIHGDLLSESYVSPPPDLEISDISYRVTERGGTVWWRYAYQITLTNNSDRVQVRNAEIRFLDEDGFIIDRGRERGLTIQPNSQRSFRGDKLVSLPGAKNVTSMEISLSSR